MCTRIPASIYGTPTSTLFSKSSHVPMELHRKDLCYVGRGISEHVGTSVDMFQDEKEKSFVLQEIGLL